LSQSNNGSILRDANGHTFCQIVGHDIGLQTCFSTQGQEGCSGCASPHRLCEDCGKRIVVVAAVGKCTPCLTSALEKERAAGKPHLEGSLKMACLVLGCNITARMCAVTQGQEACRGCGAPARRCEHCDIRPVRHARFGLCLSCTVNEFADNWEPSAECAEENEQAGEFPSHILPTASPVRYVFSSTVKIRRLEGVIRGIGKGKVLAQILEAVIEDLRELERLKQ
jgi:hypothetical protein